MRSLLEWKSGLRRLLKTKQQANVRRTHLFDICKIVYKDGSENYAKMQVTVTTVYLFSNRFDHQSLDVDFKP